MTAVVSRMHWLGGLCLLLVVLALGGCRSGVPMQIAGAHQPMPAGGIDFGEFEPAPKPRLGALPYPGAFTLFDLADPDHLGHHAYNGEHGESEKSRGILYTCRGGFIDLAHARKCIDLCKYTAVRAELALMNNWNSFQIKGMEPSVYIVHLEYPPFWHSLPPAEKARLAHELSIRIGQRLAMTMVTWHELLTWFGYRAVFLVSERQSAFTYDDIGAHAFGVLVGGRALRNPNLPWDQAATEAINTTLRELGVVSREDAKRAIDQVKGQWWGGDGPTKRQFVTGLDGQALEPWLVRDLPFCRDAAAYRYELPRLDDVLGYDFRSLLRVEIEPKVWETGSIRDAIPGRPERINVDRDLPILINHMKQWHTEREGPQALRPY